MYRPGRDETAYYSMEIAISDAIPTFSGGLGVLAGDHVRSAADRGIRLVAVTLLYRFGFFRQEVGADGAQVELPVQWEPSRLLEELPERVHVPLGDRHVVVRPWRHVVTGVGGHQVPIYLLDTHLDENPPADRAIADRLYLGDRAHRLSQEVILGIGGPLALHALGHRTIRTHHMNEGHASLVPLGVLANRDPAGARGRVPDTLPEPTKSDLEWVRDRCVFTTHTPVPAGHDRFDPAVAGATLGLNPLRALEEHGLLEADGTLNMTLLGMSLSRFVNAVSVRHRGVTRQMFPSAAVESITNGVHSSTWAGEPLASLFDRRIPDWRAASSQLRYVAALSLSELRVAHNQAKRDLCDEAERRSGVTLDPQMFTIGIARRFAGYKRNDLLLSDPRRLADLATRGGPLQVLVSGKAHPQDGLGKDLLRRVVMGAASPPPGVRIVFLPDYDMSLARLMCAGSDVWLNTPEPPNEASGTSGMKAALNGVPSVSTLDGWWLEGHIEGVTGWAIGSTSEGPQGASEHAEALYRLLGDVVIPMYYRDPDRFDAVRRNAIALNASFFSGHRMVDEYARRAYGDS